MGKKDFPYIQNFFFFFFSVYAQWLSCSHHALLHRSNSSSQRHPLDDGELVLGPRRAHKNEIPKGPVSRLTRSSSLNLSAQSNCSSPDNCNGLCWTCSSFSVSFLGKQNCARFWTCVLDLCTRFWTHKRNRGRWCLLSFLWLCAVEMLLSTLLPRLISGSCPACSYPDSMALPTGLLPSH